MRLGVDSVLPKCSLMSVFIDFNFGSQNRVKLLRFFRICSKLEGFTERLRNIFFKFLDLGFDRELLKSRFVCVAEKHNFIGKLWSVV